MKLVTLDYGCGTSSSILDYCIQDVVVVSEDDYSHVFEVEDDLLFIGHDFLFFLWDSEEKLKRWQSRAIKFEHWVWCFERIDSIVPIWQQKSHYSLQILSKFCKRILACDEDDCDKYRFDWLPQWASKRFYDLRSIKPQYEKILFSGQAGGPEYHIRNVLLSNISQDVDLSSKIVISNTKRSLSWDDYVNNLLKYQFILNPIGILKALNTRAYEVLYSDRLLFQQAAGQYKRHQNLLKDCPSIVFFETFDDLKRLISEKEKMTFSGENSYEKHSLFNRMKSIGIDIK